MDDGQPRAATRRHGRYPRRLGAAPAASTTPVGVSFDTDGEDTARRFDQRPRHLRDPAFLLKRVVARTSYAKRKRMGVGLPLALAQMGRVPGLLARYMARATCQSTAVLTNLGRPFAKSPLMGADGLVRAGNMTLMGMDSLPTVRQGTLIAISVNYYANVLSLTLRYDSTVFSARAAADLLSDYANQLAATVHDRQTETVAPSSGCGAEAGRDKLTGLSRR